MGKRMFEEGEANWPEDLYQAPVFVVTREKRDPWARRGSTVLYFVNEGIESALTRAKNAARGKDVRIGRRQHHSAVPERRSGRATSAASMSNSRVSVRPYGCRTTSHEETPVKITVETIVKAPLNKVWDAWNNPADIQRWNAAQDDWHTTRSSVDLREGGKFLSRMEAKDGSAGFDFEGVYTRVVPKRAVEYRMSDGREVQVEFVERPGGVLVKETFDAESENPPELQRQGWQAILDNFGRYVERKS